MYIVIELQKLNDTTVANLVYQKQTLNEAESTYHSILSYAAVSSVPVHSAVILTDAGQLVMSKAFRHEVAEEMNSAAEPVTDTDIGTVDTPTENTTVSEAE